MGEVEAEDRVAGLQQRRHHRGVGLRARVRLHVGVLRAEQRLQPVDRQLLDDVDVLAAAVVATPRVALGVLVGQDRALRLPSPRAGRSSRSRSSPASTAGGAARRRSPRAPRGRSRPGSRSTPGRRCVAPPSARPCSYRVPFVVVGSRPGLVRRARCCVLGGSGVPDARVEVLADPLVEQADVVLAGHQHPAVGVRAGVIAGWQRSQASKSCSLTRWNSSTERLRSPPEATTSGRYSQSHSTIVRSAAIGYIRWKITWSGTRLMKTCGLTVIA